MTTLADSLVDAASRPISLRMRPDLQTRKHRYQGRVYWVVKEPIGLTYFRFHEEEYSILSMLDGQTSMQRIKEQFEEDFAPQKITFPDLQHFIGMLHRSGLVISEARGQGRQLKRRRDQKKWKEIGGKLANLLCVRFRGVDPERFFNFIYPYIRWFFSTPAFVAAGLLVLSALTLVAVRYDVMMRDMPDFQSFFGPHNWIYLAIAMAVVKVLHEFGHGLSCKHYGGECHELGAMLLVFTPALYCNVSDSWMLPNKYHRAFIGAAGMYVEVIIASICTWIWYWTRGSDSMLNNLCLSTMFVCSVSTLMFNGNPLLRFDGYYILMDLLEIPNLHQKASEVLRRWILQNGLGIEQPDNPFLPQRNRFLFALFIIASNLYRWFVTFSILMFLNQVLKPYGLQVIGFLLGMVGVFGLVVMPVIQMVRFLYTPGRMNQVKTKNVVISSLVVATAVGLFCFLPLPHFVYCEFDVVPSENDAVFVQAAGQIDSVEVKPGDSVVAGQRIAKLRNEELDLQLVRLKSLRRETVSDLQMLKSLSNQDPTLLPQIPPLEDSLRMLDKQVEVKEQEAAKLILNAHRSGEIAPPPVRNPGPMQKDQLPDWSGSPFEERNLGALMNSGELFCHVVDRARYRAVLMIDQGDMEFIAPDKPVTLKFDLHPDDWSYGKITTIARSQIEALPPSLSSSAGGSIAAKPDPSGMQRPISTTYQAEVMIDKPPRDLRSGMRGRARVYTGTRSAGARLWRYLAQTFHFKI
jgi:putative peptide zinc metalloprotease protein